MGFIYIYAEVLKNIKRYESHRTRARLIKNRTFIDERPKIVDEKTRIGEWKIDTIIGKRHQKSLVTLVERFSKKALISRVIQKRAELVANETKGLPGPFKDSVLLPETMAVNLRTMS